MTLDHHAAPWVSKDKYAVASSARRYEQWECNFAGLVALGVAIDYATDLGVKWIETRVQALARQLRVMLRNVGPAVTVYDLGGPGEQCGIVSFAIQGLDSRDVHRVLLSEQMYLNVTGSSSTLLDATQRQLPSAMLRASVHYFNTVEELATVVAVVNAMCHGTYMLKQDTNV